MVLQRIEETTGQAIGDLFDLIAGTSTGGLIALALSRRREDRTPALAAHEVVDLYLRHGPTIFGRSTWRRITKLGSMLGPKYCARRLEAILDQYLGDVELAGLAPDVLITGYELHHRDPMYFRSRLARTASAMENYRARDVGRATTAAPTYFSPASISPIRAAHRVCCVDGGVFANNPSLSAYIEAMQLYPRTSVLMVSLGTGDVRDSIEFESACRWGVAGWARPLVSVVLDGTSQATHYHMENLLGERDYFRFQVGLPRGGIGLDAVDPQSLATLQLLGRYLLLRQRGRLEELCRRL